jgi:hypothetical protein
MTTESESLEYIGILEKNAKEYIKKSYPDPQKADTLDQKLTEDFDQLRQLIKDERFDSVVIPNVRNCASQLLLAAIHSANPNVDGSFESEEPVIRKEIENIKALKIQLVQNNRQLEKSYLY